MTIGWNLEDTLDACQADRDGDGIINEHMPDGEEPDETLWGNPAATPELFQALWDSGVNAVRIPVTWLSRVQEVVDYAYDIGMMKTNFTDNGIPVIVGEYAVSGEIYTPEKNN